MELGMPNPHALGVMIIIGIALFLFTREKIPLETTSLVVLVAIAVGFQLFPYEQGGKVIKPSDFFLGFGHKALIAVSMLMIVGQGLIRTGALEPIGRILAKVWRRAPIFSLLLTMLIAAVLSAFINNTPIVVLLLPLLIGVAIRNGRSPSGMLLPMGLASIIGGMATTIGTSTNLLVVGVAEDMGMDAFGMFDFLGPASIGAVFAIAYLWLIAPKLIPERQPPLTKGVSRLYTAQIELADDSPALGETLADAIERAGGNLRVERIQRGPGVFVTPLPDVVLAAGDRITTTDTQDNLREYSRLLGGALYSGDTRVDDEHPLTAGGQQIAEVAITPASRLIGTEIRMARLRSRYGLRMLAFHRFEEAREPRSPGLDTTELRAGDVLLVQSTPENLAQLKESTEFLILDGSVNLPKTRKAPVAALTLITVVALAAFDILPIEISATLGALFLILSRCLTWKEAISALSVQVVLIIVASLAMGDALMQTNGADWLALAFLKVTFGAPSWVVLASLMLLMAAMTNVVSNNAAAVIGTPIAIGIAQRLGMPLEPFVLAVLFGANLSFATPMAYKTNILVMNAGGYKFGDFVRVGLPLTFLLWIVLSATLVLAYGLY